MKISRLPLDVANKIAAGEVVERPASVVKELVENSVDAGALNIAVEVSGGGLGLIRVVDDGCGMDSLDAEMALERHATSKVKSVEDLFRVDTLGFRGEALPSIASVSRLRIITREDGSDAAWRVDSEGGRITGNGPASGRKGTSVEVEELFFNTPARLKYLRSAAAEARRIEQVMEKLALANPAVSMKLSADGVTVFEAPGGGELRAAARAVLGRAAEDMTEGAASSPGVDAFVLLAGGEHARRRRQDQYIVVNGRPVSSNAIYAAIDRALEGAQMGAPYPPAVVWLEIDPSRVDVNVHPAKAEVRFADESSVFSAVRQAVSNALTCFEAAPKITAGFFGEKEAPGKGPVETTAAGEAMGERYSGYFAAGSGKAIGWAVREGAYGHVPGYGAIRGTGVHRQAEGAQEIPEIDDTNAPPRVIGQFKDSYILADRGGELVIIDQHVAHERILVDRFLGALEENRLDVQSLLLPQTVELMPAEASAMRQEPESLRSLGFDAEPFGARDAIIRAVPLIGGIEPSPEALLVAALRDLAEGRQEASDVGGRLRRAATEMACKGAVKAGSRLEREQMEEIVDGLFRSTNPFRCPHGRPILLKVDLSGIERGVGRR